MRITDLEKNPAGFHIDELITGYEAYNLLKTGRDHYSIFLPIFFKGVTGFDNATPFQFYLTAPFVSFFGLSEFSVRLASVSWSMVELFLYFLLISQLIPSPFALLGTMMLSVSPWSFHISRLGMGHFSWGLTTLIPFIFTVKLLKNGGRVVGLTTAFFFGIATYGYTPARLLTPIFFLFAILFASRKIGAFIILQMILIYSFTLIPFIRFHLTDSHSFERIKTTVGIDVKNTTLAEISDKNIIDRFINKYPAHFSDTFLYLRGDADYPGQFMKRHSIIGLGLLYKYQKWLIVMGLIWTFVKLIKNKDLVYLYFLFILLLIPIPDSLTHDATPFATRNYLSIIPLSLFSILGLHFIYKIVTLLFYKVKINKIENIYFITSFLLIIYPMPILIKNFHAYPLKASNFWGWQYGPKQIIQYFLSLKDNYDDLYISGEFNGDLFIEFYDPENLCRNKCKVGDFWREPSIVKPTLRQIFSLSPQYLDNSGFKDIFSVKNKIIYPDGTEAFLIGELTP